jgi:Fn3-like domain
VSQLPVFASASFSASSITIRPRGYTSFNVTITAPAALKDLDIYGGFIVLTPSAGTVDNITYSVRKLWHMCRILEILLTNESRQVVN